MNDYGVIFKPARVALILLALSILMAFTLVSGLARLRTEKELSILQTEKQLADTREHIRKLTFDLDSINRLAAKYKRLTRLGFIGEPDRDSWVQRLESIFRDTRLPPTLRYTLSPPALINPQAVPDEAPTAYQNKVFHHDLNFELSGIHEGEFLDFMDKLSADWRTPYRIDTCQFMRGDANEPIAGLQIKCTVQLYSVPGK
jgi:hypothetical protein